ncbi:putative Peptidase A1 domain-containing protein [Seiridium unicorne]|uniref:Peptidase A1 domain-containing protein n=1 Tax=Seiridium unicorne TaxID=138068 RepID=A0ABR2USR0_9PEZI
MYRAVVLCQLTLWISGIQAFLPLHSESLQHVRDDEKRDNMARDAVGSMGFVTFKMSKAGSSKEEDISKRVTRIAHNLARKYGSELPSRTVHEDASLVDRANTYSVVTPVTPTQSNSAGIYQDGTDYSYFIQAHIGSAATPMYMLIDTGASTTWVMGSGCTSDACTKHNTFGSEDSKTLKDTGKSFSVEYGSGDVSGHYVDDTMKVAGFSVPYEFGLANVTSSQFSSFPFDGILGLARNSGNFNDALKEADAISANIFAVSLSRNSDGTDDGEISFGGVNTAKYTGDITYSSTTDDSSWSIAMDDVSVGGTSAGVKGRTAYIDTGTTYAFAPPADVKALYKLIPDSQSSDGVTYTFPCDTTAKVALTFSGTSYSINAKDFGTSGSDNKCTGNIFGMEVVSGSWLLGDMFLKNVYSVFDIDGERIGFASKSTSSETTTAVTPSSTIVSTVTSENGATTLTTITSSSTATGAPSMGFTGGHESSSVGANPTTTTETATSASSTGTSSADQSQVQGIYVSISCIISIIALVI